MKITGIKLYMHTEPLLPGTKSECRVVGPLDVYEEYALDLREKNIPHAANLVKDGNISSTFLVVETDEGLQGIHGPIEYRGQLLVAVEGLAPHLVGRDPLETRLLWDIMSRFDRHSRSGLMMMAISTVDIALWDLKGKILGQPVWRVLGGGRRRVRPYVSMLGFSVEPEKARERALMVRDMGVGAQKWFFRYGPTHGAEGMRKNLALAYTLRETLGDDYELMFDCWMGWDIAYAKTIFRELEAVRPMWVEEVLRPHMQEAYELLRQQTSIRLSAGEHLYTRMEVNPYLRKGVFDVIQSDPEWCGGITETMRIADLCEVYGTRFIPHGHSLMSALSVISTMPPDICPYAEYLLLYQHLKNHFYSEKRLGADGWLTLNDTPGLGEDLDMERITHTEEVTGFTFGK